MNTKTGFVSYDFHDFHDIHCRKGYRGYHVWSRDLRISVVMTFSKSPKNHPTMASSLPQLQPSDRTYRTLGLQMTTKFFEIDHPFLPGDFSGRFEQKKGVVLIVWTYFLHISATSWFRISSFKNGIHFSTRHTNPPSLAEEHEPSPAAVWRAEAVHVQRLDDSEEPGQWSYQGDAKDVNRWKGNPGNWWNIILFTYIYIYICWKDLGRKDFFFFGVGRREMEAAWRGWRWRSQWSQAQKYADALKAYSKALENLKPFGGDDARHGNWLGSVGPAVVGVGSLGQDTVKKWQENLDVSREMWRNWWRQKRKTAAWLRRLGIHDRQVG